jgi:Flp pilus assembly pilin Flp
MLLVLIAVVLLVISVASILRTWISSLGKSLKFHWS